MFVSRENSVTHTSSLVRRGRTDGRPARFHCEAAKKTASALTAAARLIERADDAGRVRRGWRRSDLFFPLHRDVARSRAHEPRRSDLFFPRSPTEHGQSCRAEDEHDVHD